MNILIVSPFLPHYEARNGGSIAVYEYIKEFLLKPGVNITLICFCDKEEYKFIDFARTELLTISITGIYRKKNKISVIPIRIFQLLRSIFTLTPYYVCKYYNRQMCKEIEALTRQKQFNIVQFEMSYMGQYGEIPTYCKKILHDHDVTIRPLYRQYKHSNLFIKMFYLFQIIQWKRYYKSIIKYFDTTICVTEQDKFLLQRITNNREKITYFPLGIFSPQIIPKYSNRNKNRILFVGSFLHRPNIDAALYLIQKIFPLVLLKCPNAKLFIIGNSIPHKIYSAGNENVSIFSSLLHNNVLRLLDNCTVFVAPLQQGGGMKTKIRQAMSRGIPIVTTKIGKEGIDCNDIFVSEDLEKIVDFITKIFLDPKVAEIIGNELYYCAKNKYSWSKIIDNMILEYKK